MAWKREGETGLKIFCQSFVACQKSDFRYNRNLLPGTGGGEANCSVGTGGGMGRESKGGGGAARSGK